MIFDLAQLIVFLATVVAYGYYLYLIGKVKGVLKSVEIVLKQREDENETDVPVDERYCDDCQYCCTSVSDGPCRECYQSLQHIKWKPRKKSEN